MSERAYGVFQTPANTRLIADLSKRGEVSLLLPQTTISKTNFSGEIALWDYDWLVFSDSHSVDVFLESVGTRVDLDAHRICAVGESIADRLRFSQHHADVIPALRDAETVARAISEYESLNGLRSLLLSGDVVSQKLVDKLKEGGASVTELILYTTEDLPELSRFKTLLRCGAIDEFIFASPQEVFDLDRIVTLREAEFTMAATDEITFQTLREFCTTPKYLLR